MRTARLNSLTLRAVIAVLIGSFCLSACGVKGDLDIPPPLWGEAKNEADNASAGNPILNESPIDNNEDDDIFGSDYIEETEPF